MIKTTYMQELANPELNEAYQLEQFIIHDDYYRFIVLLENCEFEQHTLDKCLAYAAASEKKGNYCEALVEAGGDIQYYKNGRLTRAAEKGSIVKLERWKKAGGDIHHNNDMPLRAALFKAQENTTRHLLSLGCTFAAAVTTDTLQTVAREQKTGRDALRLYMKLRSEFYAELAV